MSAWKSRHLKWVQCVIPRKDGKKVWFLEERNSVLRSLKHLFKAQEMANSVFLLAIFSEEFIPEIAQLYEGKSYIHILTLKRIVVYLWLLYIHIVQL